MFPTKTPGTHGGTAFTFQSRMGWAFAFLGTANTGPPPALRGLHPFFLTKKRGCCFFRNRGWTCPFRAAIIYLLFVTASDNHRGGCSYLGLSLMPPVLNPLQMPRGASWFAEAQGEPLCDSVQQNFSAQGGVPSKSRCVPLCLHAWGWLWNNYFLSQSRTVGGHCC